MWNENLYDDIYINVTVKLAISIETIVPNYNEY